MYAFKRIYVCGYITSRDGIEWKLKKKIGEIFSENIILSAEEVYLELEMKNSYSFEILKLFIEDSFWS